jgi:hypothetical protein
MANSLNDKQRILFVEFLRRLAVHGGRSMKKRNRRRIAAHVRRLKQ